MLDRGLSAGRLLTPPEIEQQTALFQNALPPDFGTLRDILGHSLVDMERGLIREELLGPNQEEDLIEAVWFEEMHASALSDDLLVPPSHDAEDGDDESE